MGKKEETSNTVGRRGRSTRTKKVDQQESQTQNREGEEVSVDLEEDEEEEIGERPSTRGSRRGKSTVNVEVTANRTTRAGRGRKKEKDQVIIAEEEHEDEGDSVPTSTTKNNTTRSTRKGSKKDLPSLPIPQAPDSEPDGDMIISGKRGSSRISKTSGGLNPTSPASTEPSNKRTGTN